MKKAIGLLLSVLLVLNVGAKAAHAQKDHASPITIVLAYAAGGPAEPLVRLLAQKLQERLGRTVMVDYRPGANGVISVKYLLQQPADGTTILFHSSSLVQTLAVSPGKPPYDLDRDIQPLLLLGRQKVALVVPGNDPYMSLADLAKAVKANPNAFVYGSYGPGSIGHIYGEALRTAFGVEMPHIPFRGSNQLLTEMMGGRIQMAFVSAATAYERQSDGSIRSLAVTGLSRTDALPNVPTMLESGYPGFEAVGWWGLFLRSGTPATVADPLLTSIRAVLNEPDVALKMRDFVLEASQETPEEISSSMRSEYKYWEALIRKFKISAGG